VRTTFEPSWTCPLVEVVRTALPLSLLIEKSKKRKKIIKSGNEDLTYSGATWDADHVEVVISQGQII